MRPRAPVARSRPAARFWGGKTFRGAKFRGKQPDGKYKFLKKDFLRKLRENYDLLRK